MKKTLSASLRSWRFKNASLPLKTIEKTRQPREKTLWWTHGLTALIHLSVRHFCRAALHYIPMGDVKRLCRARKALREGGASFEKMLRVKKLADAHLYANEFR